ncbi:MAG: xylanase [Chitinophagaceae bacterium]|nr:MAG: xylanase [Chitinophagaceae bacterium]
MDPAAGADFKRSHLTKIALLTLSFAAFYVYKEYRSTKKAKSLLVVKKDSSTIITASFPTEEIKMPKKKKKTIYLTFDDGPNKGTKNVLDIINNEQIPVTLFVIGEHVYGSKLQASVYDSVRSSAYIELANHSFTHAHNKFSKFYSAPADVVNDFRRCADSLSLSSNIVRTPGRNIWRLNDIKQTDNHLSKEAADALEKSGYIVMGWDLEWHFDDKLRAIQSSDQLASQIDSMFLNGRTKTLDHLVLLAHDQVYSNAKDSSSLRQLVGKLKEKGDYDFAFINSYPGIEKLPLTDSGLLKK